MSVLSILTLRVVLILPEIWTDSFFSRAGGLMRETGKGVCSLDSKFGVLGVRLRDVCMMESRAEIWWECKEVWILRRWSPV